MSPTYEVNFDGLIGNTHNYAGLSAGNLASTNNALQISRPREAAKQGLTKMNFLHTLGMKQGIFLPQERPHIPTLKNFGFSGTEQAIIGKAQRSAPELLAMCYSASSMWAANAATVSPSADTSDGRVHFTPANLKSMFHRSIEHGTTSAMLRRIFDNEKYFVHHDTLAGGIHFGDEGAANHNRLCEDYSERGVELFVYGRKDFGTTQQANNTRFPARQSLEASAAIARNHQLNPEKVIFVQQNPKVIDAGGFHNDVVSVANKNVLFMHEQAFVDKKGMAEKLKQTYGPKELHMIEVAEAAVSLEDAVSSYLFNSQLINLPEKEEMMLLLPMESRENDKVFTYLQSLVAENSPIKQFEFIDVRQSMRNGGGPACLRLRVVLTEQELAHVNPTFLFNNKIYRKLVDWVEAHYRDELRPADFVDPQLLIESRTALDELTQILELGSFYEFQRV